MIEALLVARAETGSWPSGVLGPVGSPGCSSRSGVDSVTLPATEPVSFQLRASRPTIFGLLGSDMLSLYRTMTIDYQTGTITLR
jgi:hypothetical protein